MKMICGLLILISLTTIVSTIVNNATSLDCTDTYLTCTTPNNLRGKCIPLKYCNSVNQLMHKAPIYIEELEFLQQSQCGIKNQVCCADLQCPLPTESTENKGPTRTLTTSTPVLNSLPVSKPDLTTSTTSRHIPESVRISAPSPVSTERISARKCREYKEFAFNTTYAQNTIIGDQLEMKVSNCAFKVISLIVNGTEAIQREFPHMALIGFEMEGMTLWRCGGTLISEQFVLSVAHCSNPSRLGPARYVRLGEHDTSQTRDSQSIDVNIIERFPHPDYEKSKPYNDIALFKLDRNVRFNHAIRPGCLTQQSGVPNYKATATGWGHTAYGGSRSDVLLKVELDMSSHSVCNRAVMSQSQEVKDFLYKGIDEETHMCAGSPGKDTCQGDSGGPLQIHHESHDCCYTVVGVTSIGIGCGIPGIPGIYTSVYPYLSWIENIVWPEEKKIMSFLDWFS